MSAVYWRRVPSVCLRHLANKPVVLRPVGVLTEGFDPFQVAQHAPSWPLTWGLVSRCAGALKRLRWHPLHRAGNSRGCCDRHTLTSDVNDNATSDADEGYAVQGVARRMVQ